MPKILYITKLAIIVPKILYITRLARTMPNILYITTTTDFRGRTFFVLKSKPFYLTRQFQWVII